MSGLPGISGFECVKALNKIGFYLKRREGSHMLLRRNDALDKLLSPTTKKWIAAHFAPAFANLVWA